VWVHFSNRVCYSVKFEQGCYVANGFLNSLTDMMGIEDNIVKLISDFV